MSSENMPQPVSQIPQVGVALLILNGPQVLLGRRLKSPMPGSWQLPGGWLHHGETCEQAVTRKVEEFPNMICDQPRFVTYTNNRFAQGLHSVSLYFEMRCLSADQINLEQNKHCSDWFWADWYDMPDSLFLPLSLLKSSGYQPFIPAV